MSLDHLLSGDLGFDDDIARNTEIVAQYTLPYDALRQVQYRNELLLLSTSHSICVYQLNKQSCSLLQSLSFHTDSITSLILSNHSFISTSKDHQIIQYSGDPLASLSITFSSTLIHSMATVSFPSSCHL